MDNFMDKLAKRFNAGEIIKANAQAEARDMKRLQERAAEYEKMMMEMRRLNLKNVEVTEQVQQLIQCGIEQFEGYGNGDALIGQKLDELQNELNALQNELSAMSKEAQSNNSTFQNLSLQLNGLDNGVGSLRYQLSNIENDVRTLEQSVKENMDKGIDAQALQPILDNVDGLKAVLTENRTSVDDGFRKLEEHVHKENVRVYRNVQAAIVDENGKKAREINMRMDQLEAVVKKNSGIKAIAIVTMLAAFLSVALQVVQLLGLF